MSIAPNIEAVRQLLEELKERASGFVRQKALKAEVLDGLSRAMEALDAAGGELPSQHAAAVGTENDSGLGPSGRGGASEEYRALNRALQACSHSNQVMISAMDELRYLQDVCRIVVDDCGHAMVWIGYAEDDEGKTVRPVAHSGFEEGYLETLKITWSDSERGRGPTGTAIRRGKPCVCANMQQDPKFAPWRKEALKRGYASSVVLPLMNEGRAFGAITIYAREPEAFSPDEVTLLSELAADLSFGILSIRLRLAHARSEVLLQRSEKRFRSIVELSPDAIFVNHNGRVAYVNQAGLELFGAAETAQILGRSPYALFHPDYHSKMRERMDTLFCGGSVPLTEARLVRLDGTFRDVEVAASLYDAPEGQAIQVVLRDITERKLAEEALARERANLQSVFDAANFGMLLLDGDGAVRRVNETLARWIGEDLAAREGGQPGDLVGCIHALADPAGCGGTKHCGSCAIRGAFESALRSGQPVHNVETESTLLIGGDKVGLWLEISADPLVLEGQPHVLLGMSNITERKRVEEALRLAQEELERRVDERTAELRAMNEALQQEIEARKRAKEVASRLAAIVSSSDEAILSKTPDGIILTWNRGAERLLGYSEGEVVGRHVAFVTPPDRSEETQEILDRIRRGERIEHLETMRLRKDGSRVAVSLTISPMHDLAGRVTGASEIAHDITERKRMEDELRQASEYARSLIEASLDPLVIIGLSGEITDVNEAMERMTGLPRRQLAGSDFAQCFTAADKAMEVFERVLTDGTVTDFPLTVRHRSGGTTDVIYNATVYRNAAGEVQGVFAAARDITRRKRAEEELVRYREHLEDLVRQRTGELEVACRQLQEDMAARERLEAERLRLIDILEATPDMVSYSDSSGKVLYFNQAARKILGIPLGAELADIDIPKGYPEWANKMLQEVAVPTAVLEGLWSGETAVLDAEGNEIPVSQVIVAHKDASGQVAYFSTIARDVSAQKRAERDLKALASFPAENPSPVLRTTGDGLLIYANESAERLLDAWGCAAGDHVPAHVTKEITRALSRGKTQEAEYQADELVYSVLFTPVRETGHVNLYGRDITARRQIEDALVRARDELEQRVEDRTAELLQVNVALVNKIEEHARTAKALRNSQMRLAEAQRIAHLGGWEWDIRSGNFIWSDEVFRILGLNPRDQAPTFAEFLEWMPAEDAKLVERTVLRAVAEKKPFTLDHRLVLPNGEIRHAHAQAEIVLDGTGAAVRMLGTIMDTTERIRAEEEVRVRQQQLIQADKMVSLGILVAGVAHEINNPNHSIMSNVGALAGVWESARPILDRFYKDFGDFVLGGFEYSECRDKLSDMFSNALANSKRIEVIVTELRDFARNSPKENMAAVDVNDVVKSAIILMANMIKKCTDHFSVAYGTDLPPVLGNFQRIEQVVINLVQNACQALASRDRSVRVATSHDPASGSVSIMVCDEGVGIPEENSKQLGTPFFTTKRGSEGMGLGLWICSNIAHEHGGVLTFSPRTGGGTQAVLALPANGHLAVAEPVEREL